MVTQELNIISAVANSTLKLTIVIRDSAGNLVSGLTSMDFTLSLVGVSGTTYTDAVTFLSEVSTGLYIISVNVPEENCSLKVETAYGVFYPYFIYLSPLLAFQDYGDYTLYGLARINTEPHSGVRVRLLTEDDTPIRDVISFLPTETVTIDGTDYEYNFKLRLTEPGTYYVEFIKPGYIVSKYKIVVPDEPEVYFDNVLAI